MMYVSTAAGFVLLFGGGEFLVRGAVAISRRLGLSPMLIGMTVVAFCTSAPELLVSVRSALAGNPDITVGNVVGSVICNIVLIMGLSALVKPIAVDKEDVKPDVIMMLAGAAALFVLGLLGTVERWHGVLMVATLLTFIAIQYRREIKAGTEASDWHAEETEGYETPMTLLAAAGAVAGGLAALVFGAELLISGATQIAAVIGIPDAVIGLTIVAIGTSLPELATSVIAVKRGHSDVAVGNMVGASTVNMLLILGTTAVILPVPISPTLARMDIPLMFGISVVVTLILLLRGRFGRIMGMLMTSGYAVYIAYLYRG